VIAVTLAVEGDQGTFTIVAKGINARIPPTATALLAGEPESGIVDAHGIQPYYTGLIARAARMKVGLSIDGDAVTIAATADAG
jgi:histidine phosphotransferase ChpT